jgi:hypothetical protein
VTFVVSSLSEVVISTPDLALSRENLQKFYRARIAFAYIVMDESWQRFRRAKRVDGRQEKTRQLNKQARKNLPRILLQECEPR